ncbi:hypothetical protein TKK_0005875 [Trichogramma kaykai]
MVVVEILENGGYDKRMVCRLRAKLGKIIRTSRAQTKDYLNLLLLAHSNKLSKFRKKYQESCDMHLREKLSRRFFLAWARIFFAELIRYRLPYLCCEIIINRLMNQDLYHVCLAAAGQARDINENIRDIFRLV